MNAPRQLMAEREGILVMPRVWGKGCERIESGKREECRGLPERLERAYRGDKRG